MVEKITIANRSEKTIKIFHLNSHPVCQIEHRTKRYNVDETGFQRQFIFRHDYVCGPQQHISALIPATY